MLDEWLEDAQDAGGGTEDGGGAIAAALAMEEPVAVAEPPPPPEDHATVGSSKTLQFVSSTEHARINACCWAGVPPSSSCSS